MEDSITEWFYCLEDSNSAFDKRKFITKKFITKKILCLVHSLVPLNDSLAKISNRINS